MTRRLTLAALALSVAAPVWAQTHAVKKPETVVRAVAVYEFTGPEEKPTASRLVPVSLFINSQLVDAGLYLARPVPFALDRGTIFEVDEAGIPQGTIDIAFQRHLEATGDAPFDDGWLGYGLFKPNPREAPVVAGKQRGPLPQVVASGGSRPKLVTRGDSSSSASSTSTASTDDSKPTMKRRDDSSGGTAASPATGGADSKDASTTVADNDPDRPVLVRRNDTQPDSSSDSSSGTAVATSNPTGGGNDADKPTMRRRTDDSSDTSSGNSSTDSSEDASVDRPTLKKRTPEQQKKNNRRPGDTASVSSAGNLNDDPDRPTLHRGTLSGPEIPPLTGLPADMQQRVAVSDAKDRPQHNFSRSWESTTERADVLATMEDLARTRLLTYDVPAAGVSAPAPAAPPAASAAGKTAGKPSTATATTKAAAARARKAAAAAAAAPPAPAVLTEEQLRSYTLSYGGAATFIYSAASPGDKGATRYVTIVAQREPGQPLRAALTSVTDSTHLDRTPWMRLVDVVDAEASNRASLLFELRASHTRQFALYRVIGSAADQIFTTGTTD